eukprot:CAMPEP_0169268738 /NCGR_PEP_ID=MMETSP1016-20121227/48000_1 /TAXON_ID=342587 /ORGANISM="Karlodinium micrum, Strain CCMP2283" /LENGTH=159 /DNA_ID=CAMNT_0009353549 /DNA_START=184 /DNA_END=663 /DNA_ORIENTATION=-
MSWCSSQLQVSAHQHLSSPGQDFWLLGKKLRARTALEVCEREPLFVAGAVQQGVVRQELERELFAFVADDLLAVSLAFLGEYLAFVKSVTIVPLEEVEQCDPDVQNHMQSAETERILLLPDLPGISDADLRFAAADHEASHSPLHSPAVPYYLTKLRPA